jgi:hypothetical protein
MSGVLTAKIKLHNPPAMFLDKAASDESNITSRAQDFRYLVWRLDRPNSQPEWLDYEKVCRYSAFKKFLKQNHLKDYDQSQFLQYTSKDTLTWDVVPDKDYLSLLQKSIKLNAQQQQLQQLIKAIQKTEAENTSAVATALRTYSASTVVDHPNRFFGPDHPFDRSLSTARMKVYDKCLQRGQHEAPSRIVERYKEPRKKLDWRRFAGTVEEKIKGQKKRHEICCDFCSTFYPNCPFIDITYMHNHDVGDTLTFKTVSEISLKANQMIWIVFYDNAPFESLHLQGEIICN